MKYFILILFLLLIPQNISPAQTVIGSFIITSSGSAYPNTTLTMNGVVVTMNGVVATFTHS